ncbi:MAG: phosphoenolpyruvate--protein phosphotransferase [Oscillospiraceae bacterium]|nr:phosphoenolpyruvate--protein phosphotransferase [Oscillospiraceae bacterium]
MQIIKGTSVYSSIADGPLRFFKKASVEIIRNTSNSPEVEISHFEKAKALAMEQLDDLYKKASKDAGDEIAALFEVHKMMLDDPDFYEPVINMINEQNVSAEYAVDETSKELSEVFSSMDDAYMKERSADILDISKRVQIALAPEKHQPFILETPSIIAADDLAPSETIQLEKHLILGFVMMEGSLNSHTSILAKSMGIPAIIGTGTTLSPEYDNKPAILDGTTGTLYIEPDDSTVAAIGQKKEELNNERQKLEALKGLPNITKDGREIKVYANALDLSGINTALENDAGGIGLFRSEFLYLENTDYPSEQEQFEVYKKAAEQMKGKKVIIRTLDIGADKQAPYFNLPAEENPAMGMRAIRICLTRPEVFKTQLRALYRASAFGDIAIMFPMITGTWEIDEIKKIITEVKESLKQDNIEFNEDAEIGIMIETPAAVIISEELAKMVQFFSIGTNDLTQYTLAVDRQNRDLERFCDTHHPAVLKMIEMTVRSAHKAGIWCGICGELASDLTLTETFLHMGVDELSVSAGMVLKLRDKIRSLDLS